MREGERERSSARGRERKSKRERASTKSRKQPWSPSTFAVTREIVSKYGLGLNGLNKGLSATIMRNAVFNSFYFGFYHSVKGYVLPREGPWLEFLSKVIEIVIKQSRYVIAIPTFLFNRIHSKFSRLLLDLYQVLLLRV